MKRWRFGSSAESLDTSTQTVLFDAILADTTLEYAAAKEANKPPPAAPAVKGKSVRQALPVNLPRVDRHYDIGATHCACGQAFKRIGEEVSEQLDCVPAQFFVLRHIRGKYACACCQTIQAAPMPAQMIDKGIPAAGLLAQVAIAKIDDHLPLYRQTEIYARSGVHIPRSSMAQWLGICGVRLEPLAAALKDFILGHDVLHADETPVALLAPGRGKTKKAFVWVYRTTNFVTQRAVLYDFTLSRSGGHPRRVLGAFGGTLVTDDFSGYHALHSKGVTAAFCMAHARRKLFEVFELNASPITGQAVALIARALRDRARGKGSRQRGQTAGAPAAIQTRGRRIACLAHDAAPATGQGRCHRQGDQLCVEQLARADDVPQRRSRAHRQQRGRERHPPARCRTQELALRGVAADRRACRCADEPDRIGQTQRTRSVGLPQKRLRAPAHAEESRPGAVVAAQLATGQRHRRARHRRRGRTRVDHLQHTTGSNARMGFAERLRCSHWNLRITCV